MSLYLGENLISGQTTLVGESRNIGQIIPSAIPLTDAGLHLLDGSLIQGDGIYSDFVTYIAGLRTQYSSLFTTEANWQSTVTQYGVCGKFVYDSTNNTVRLPKITGIVEGTTDASALGDLVEAGLPNITGTFSQYYGEDIYGKGAFLVTRSAGRYKSGLSTNWATSGMTFDASRSSSIYGNNTTVQPQTIKAFYYIVIATSTKTDIQVDIDEIATDLNGKADVDLSNVTNTSGFRRLIDVYNNGSSRYKVFAEYDPTTGNFIGNWCEQEGRTNQGSDNVTVTLLKQFIDTDYSISANLIGSDGAYLSCADATISRITTTTFFIDFKGTSPAGTGSMIGYFWKACGYIN